MDYQPLDLSLSLDDLERELVDVARFLLREQFLIEPVRTFIPPITRNGDFAGIVGAP